MTKLHFDLKVVSGIPEAYLYSTSEMMRMCGANIGNFAFRYALKSLIGDFEDYTQVDYTQFLNLPQDEKIRSVIVSCANWLGTRDEDEKSNKFRADLIEKIDAPVVSFGLGVQASHGAKSLNLGPESSRLAKVLASKAKMLSVRDELTANVLAEMGIDNVVITGCPSNFINLDHGLGKSIIKKAECAAENFESWEDVRTSISEFSGGHPKSGVILKRSLRLLRTSPAFYVLQSPALFPFLFNEDSAIPAPYTKNTNMKEAQLRTVLKSKLLHFSSVDAWLDFCRTCDLAFGMRIHGNMIPMQAGVPSLLIGHDSRTSGLAGEMGMPQVSPKEFIGNFKKGPRYFFDTIREKMAGYDDRRKDLSRVMVRYLNDNGIEVSKELERYSRS